MVDAGECAIGPGFDDGAVGSDVGGFVEFGSGVGQLAAAGEEKTESYVRFEEVRVGGDSFAVGCFGGGGLVQGVLSEAEIVEEMGVVRGLFGQRGEQLQGCGIVLAVDGGIGLGTLWVFRG